MGELSQQSVPPSGIPFRYRLRVRYSECDAQKVVFNARYGDYIDLAVLEFLRASELADAMINGPFDYQLVKQTLEWKASARFDSVLDISVCTVRLGHTSFTVAVEFRLAPTEAWIAQAETVYVLTDAVTLAKAPLPEELRTALARGAPGLVVDHANSRPV